MADSHKSSEAQAENQPVIGELKRSGPPPLSHALKLEAHALALELLCQCQTNHTIVEALKKQYNCSHMVARTLLNSAAKALRAPIDETTPQKRTMMRKRLESLYRRAMATGKLTVCAQVLKQLSELEGLDEPIKVDVYDSREFGAGRSTEDLTFYAENGCWPEEAPGGAPTAQHFNNGDPLAALPPVVH